MKYSYPLLSKVFENYNSKLHNVNDIFLVCCQHILEPQQEMFKKLIDFGFKTDRIIILGKAYSTNSEVLKELNDLGIRAMQPEFSGGSFDIEHRENCRNILELIPDDAKVVLVD